jgi:diguanylate cyclase (GGDEF)-like protein/PAS domain S-box-containing protein
MKSLTLVHSELSPLARWTLAIGLFLLALAVRLWVLPTTAGMPYVTFFPATVAVYYFCGVRPGLLITALSAAAATYLFGGSAYGFAASLDSHYLTAIYLAGTLAIAIVVHQLQAHARHLQGALTRLQDNENLFRAFMDNAAFLAWMKSSDGRYIYVNQRYLQHLGIDPDNWYGKTDFDFFPAESARQFARNDNLALQAEAPLTLDETIVDLQGKASYWFSTKFPYVDSKGVKFTGGIALDITERKLVEAQIEQLAFYDPLTKLPNRRLLTDRLAQVLATGTRRQRLGALLFIDLDNFKVLNDTLGHSCGDQLLQQVAARLTATVRKGDTLARLGGDEFVVLLEDLDLNPLDAATQAKIVASKVLDALRQPYPLGDTQYHSTPSIGITLVGETDEPVNEPLRRADLAMYQAKSAGRNTLRFFDPQIQATIAARTALEADLQLALTQQQLFLVMQPQVTGERISGVEALVRWRHPARGIVSPAEFIPVAEETGLIVAIGQWVLEAACAQLAAWAGQPVLGELSIAVNVSPRQFQQPDFVDSVFAALKASGADPHKLKLELTEGMLVSGIDDVVARMTQLKNTGVGFALDDFGTGYSSLAYLKRLPLDQLKIDQSFVRDILIDPNDAAIAQIIIALADSLELAVIAEGVETPEQRTELIALGCRNYQGYLCSRPLPVGELEDFCRAASANPSTPA